MPQIWFPVKNSHWYLILDEPFLDVRYHFDFVSKLTKFQETHRDIVIIGVVHDLNLAAKFGNYLVLLYHSNVMEMGNKYEVQTEENIKNVDQIKSGMRNEKEDMHINFLNRNSNTLVIKNKYSILSPEILHISFIFTKLTFSKGL